uniref:Uncharacterized protein n=1 Tax=Anguilla anguilla TaxID=7936 RepID=A0A0E9X1G4_ANGAN
MPLGEGGRRGGSNVQDRSKDPQRILFKNHSFVPFYF